MFSDIYDSIHADDLGSTIGTFRCGVEGLPVREFFPAAVRERDDRQARASIIRAKLKGLGDGVPAETLPNEVICADRVIRRGTAVLAAQGCSAFVEVGRRVTIAEALVLAAAGAFINWRPNGVVGPDEYALVVEEEATLAVAAA
jgi:hypothetical protein